MPICDKNLGMYENILSIASDRYVKYLPLYFTYIPLVIIHELNFFFFFFK